MRKIRRLFALFLRESGPFAPRFYESGGVLRISPSVKLGGRSGQGDCPSSAATTPAAPAAQPAPDSIRDLHGLGKDIWAGTDADGYVRKLRA